MLSTFNKDLDYWIYFKLDESRYFETRPRTMKNLLRIEKLFLFMMRVL